MTAAIQRMRLRDPALTSPEQQACQRLSAEQESMLRMQYALAIIRLVNGISDSAQKGTVAKSVANLAETAGAHADASLSAEQIVAVCRVTPVRHSTCALMPGSNVPPQYLSILDCSLQGYPASLWTSGMKRPTMSSPAWPFSGWGRPRPWPGCPSPTGSSRQTMSPSASPRFMISCRYLGFHVCCAWVSCL